MMNWVPEREASRKSSGFPASTTRQKRRCHVLKGGSQELSRQRLESGTGFGCGQSQMPAGQPSESKQESGVEGRLLPGERSVWVRIYIWESSPWTWNLQLQDQAMSQTTEGSRLISVLWQRYQVKNSETYTLDFFFGNKKHGNHAMSIHLRGQLQEEYALLC